MEQCAIITRMIKRDLTTMLIKRLAEFPAVVLLGPRQVGKTTLALSITKKLPSIYLDLESPSDLHKLSDPISYLRLHENKLVILDEVQRLPNLFQILRGLIDEGKRKNLKHTRFLLLGSASIELMKQAGESLAGRVAHLELSGFNAHELAMNVANELWLRGGFPDSFLAKTDDSSFVWRENFIRTYLERDIPLLGPRIPAETLRRFWMMLSHHQGSMLNASQLAQSLAIDGKTVVRYLDLFVDLLLVRKILPWHINTGKRLVKAPKVFVRDSGLMHALLGIADFESLLSHPILGMSFEGFVIENILCNIPSHVAASFYRTSAGAEIDLLLSFGMKELWAIEIKRSITPKLEKGFYIACDDLKPQRRFIIYSGTEHYSVGDNIEVIGIKKFLALLRER